MGSKIAKKAGVKPKRVVAERPAKKAEKKETKKVQEEEEEEEEEFQLPSESESEESASEDETHKSEEESDSDDEEDEEKLGGFESTDDEQDDEDNDLSASSDEEEEKPKKTQKKNKKPEETHEVKPLPKTTTKTSQKKQKQQKGVIYIGRLPEGFEEKELQTYFNQFGDITNVKVPRSKKTGRSKHYAFVEFGNADDAKVAQETMNNYLLLNHQLKVNLVDEEFRASKKFRKAFFKVSKLKKDVKTLNENAQKKSAERKKALKAAGIDF